MFDLAIKYCFIFSKDPKESMVPFVLLLKIENYVNGAIIQMNRIERNRNSLKEMFTSLTTRKQFRVSKHHTIYLACDVHYYFICIDKIKKLLSCLAKELQDKNIYKLQSRLNKYFNIATVRNHFEHIEDRCIGYLSLSDKNKKRKQHIKDFGNFIGDNFSFNDEKYPCDKKSLKEIKTIYEELIDIVHDNYAMKDDAFVKRQEIENEHEKITKELKKAGFIK